MNPCQTNVLSIKLTATHFELRLKNVETTVSVQSLCKFNLGMLANSKKMNHLHIDVRIFCRALLSYNM